MNGEKLKPMSMVMNLPIRIDSIHDRKSVHHIVVSYLYNLIIIGKNNNQAHKRSFALDQACRYTIINSQ